MLAACAAVEEQPLLVRYEPSPPQVVSAMLELAQVTEKDVVYDLGCGDGRIVIEAARRYGARGVCIDIDPRRIAEARANAAEAGVAHKIEFREEDLMRSDLREATVVTLFLSYDLNLALRPKLERELPAGTPVVSHWHRMGEWPPEKTVHVQGAERGNPVFLFRTGGSKKLEHDGSIRAMEAKKGDALVPGFTIVQRIGEGGQAQVYLAERDYDGLRVALKVLDARVRQDKVFLERFVREYKLLAKLEMDHVVRIYDQGFAGEHPYIAMEFLPSGTLAGRIYEGMTPRNALRITAQIGRALDAIHSRGVVHRDLKPANILFRSDGRPVIVDFGLAKDLGINSTLTGQQRLLATPRYMSPEQCLGKLVDARSDIYSLGAILWEMLTRTRIYESSGPAELMRMHVTAPPPVLPEALAPHQSLLDRMLAKEPKDRFQGAADLVASITLP